MSKKSKTREVLTKGYSQLLTFICCCFTKTRMSHQRDKYSKEAVQKYIHRQR